MADITLDLIKKLRQQTQVGMMDCKKALAQTDGDFEKAVELLRKKGASVAAKRADNEINHGTIQVSVSPDFRSGSIVETGCETDFSANTADLKAFTQEVSNHVLATQCSMAQLISSSNDIELLMDQSMFDMPSMKVQDKLDELISKISEKITVTRYATIETSDGIVNAYVHPGANLGVLVELAIEGQRPADVTSLVKAAKDVAMQVAVTSPLCINPEELDPAVVEKEKEFFTEQLRSQGKPEAMLEKIIGGKLNKFYEGVCLHHQKFIKDDKLSIIQMLDMVGKQAGCKVRVANFVRFAIGSK